MDSKSTRQVGWVEDMRMLLHERKALKKGVKDEKDSFISIEQNPYRLTAILTRIHSVPELFASLVPIFANEASKEDLMLAHSTSLINQVEGTEYEPLIDFSGEMKLLHPHKSFFPFPRAKETFVNRYTYLSATVASGGVIDALKAIYETGQVERVFCAVRPPGHHCHHNKAHGFCLFNNVGIGAKYALKYFGEKVKRVMILDWDVHHGDGTQNLFYKDKSVLYFSVHRYDPKFFPETGKIEEIGEGEAKGFNINVPLSTMSGQHPRFVRNIDYMEIIMGLFFPIYFQFKPDLLFISAGYDSCAGDPVGQTFHLTPEVYAWIVAAIRKAGCKNIVTVLQGGYNFQNLANCTESTVEALLTKDPSFYTKGVEKAILKQQSGDERKVQGFVSETIERVKEELQQYWQFQ